MSFKDRIKSDLQTTAQLLAFQVDVNLMEEAAGAALLNTLNSKPNIRSAVLYNRKGVQLARFEREGSANPWSPPPYQTRPKFEDIDGDLVYMFPVERG